MFDTLHLIYKDKKGISGNRNTFKLLILA